MNILVEMSVGEARAVFFKLGVNTDDMAQDDLKKSYRQLMLKNHPDTGGDTAVAQQISAAYSALKDATPASSRTEPRSEPRSAQPIKPDFRNISYIEKWFEEQTEGKPSQKWTVMNFDGYFFRGMFTVRGNHTLFPEMAQKMINWDSGYKSRAILVGTRSMLAGGTVAVIWCDGAEVKPLVTLKFDSFNANPSNDKSLTDELPRILSMIASGEFVSQDMLD